MYYNRKNMAESAKLTALALVLAAAMSSLACNVLNDLTSPSTPTTSTSSETFSGSVGVQGAGRATFTTAKSGTVTVTLSVLSANVAVGLGIGTPSGATACTLTSSNASTLAGSTPQITGTQPAGTYCVSVYDVGNLTTTATFSIIVSHP